MKNKPFVKPTHDYIGRKKCGCVVAAVVDMPGFEKETAKTVAEFIRDGLTIERIALVDFDKILPLGCKCEPKQEQPAQERLLS